MSTPVKDRVFFIVAEQFGIKEDKVSQITRETAFVKDLGADSLDSIEMVMEFEEEFDVNIPDAISEKFRNVGQVIDYIESVGGPEAS